MNSNDTPQYRFKSFLLNAKERQLFQKDSLVPLTPKVFDVLVYLVRRSGHLVLKDDLMHAVWPDSFVDEVNLPRAIHTLRKTLGEDENDNKLIETVPTKGYRFVAEVTEVIDQPSKELLSNGQINANVSAKVRTTEFAMPSADGAFIDTNPPDERRRPRRTILIVAGIMTTICLMSLLSFKFRSELWNRFGNRSASATRHTTSDEAYRHYLLGATLTDRWTREDMRKAIANLEEAVQLDPNYALAYAKLASAHSQLAIMGGGGNTTEEYLKAKSAVEKSLAIDTSIAEAHSYLGEMKLNFEWDFEGAEREHRRAVELEPSSAAVHRMYALLLGFQGKFDDAVSEAKTAIDLDPSSVLNHKIFAQILYYARRYDESIAEAKRTVEMGSDFPAAYDSLIGSYIQKGDNDEAFEWSIKQDIQQGSTAEEIEASKATYARGGWRALIVERIEAAKQNENKGKPNAMPLARLYTKLNDRERAFEYLEQAFQQRSWAMISLKVNPSFDPLRSDPRFDDLLRRTNQQ